MPNRYGAQLTNVEPLDHRDGPAWSRLTWGVDGREYSANTYPGGDANTQVANFPSGVPATIITNGNGQVIAVEVYSDAPLE